jgi:hypothetical protein
MNLLLDLLYIFFQRMLKYAVRVLNLFNDPMLKIQRDLQLINLEKGPSEAKICLNLSDCWKNK